MFPFGSPAKSKFFKLSPFYPGYYFLSKSRVLCDSLPPLRHPLSGATPSNSFFPRTSLSFLSQFLEGALAQCSERSLQLLIQGPLPAHLRPLIYVPMVPPDFSLYPFKLAVARTFFRHDFGVMAPTYPRSLQTRPLLQAPCSSRDTFFAGVAYYSDSLAILFLVFKDSHRTPY